MSRRNLRWITVPVDRRAPLAGQGTRALIAEGVPSSATATAALDQVQLVVHDPHLEPRDEAVLLLQAAAEIEHALLVQYLFAAYSLRPEAEPDAHTIVQIAREEMAHLASVQNLLLIVGGPLHLERDDLMDRSELAPFRFRLERLTGDSLAKYVWAESPDVWDETQLARFVQGLGLTVAELRDEVERRAIRSNSGVPFVRVGAIYQSLGDRLEDMTEADFLEATPDQQATPEDWGFTASELSEGYKGAPSEPLIVRAVAGTPAERKIQAKALAQEIGRQGEDASPLSLNSHFERFLALYVKYRSSEPPTHEVATDPNASPVRAPGTPGDPFGPGRITHPRTRLWAQLASLRYRFLLQALRHFLEMSGPRYVPASGWRTGRGLLLRWTFDEMRRLRRLAGKLVRLPLHEPEDALRAGAPFEMPYTVDLPQTDPARWRAHRDVLVASALLLTALTAGATPGERPFLEHLVASDEGRMRDLDELAAGRVPSQQVELDLVFTILEEAVRGFPFDPNASHGKFWADIRRLAFFGQSRFVRIDPNHLPSQASEVRFYPKISDATDWMPRGRPRIPEERLQAIERWVRDGCRDSSPGILTPEPELG